MGTKKGMKVLFVSSEIAPFAKTGWLADVCEALPKALVSSGVAPTLVLPLYRHVREGDWPLELVGTDLPVQVGTDEITANIYKSSLTDDIPVFFVERDEFFDRSYLYGTPRGDYFDNAQRFNFFCKAIIALTEVLDVRWDIIHCHDWQTALLPVYLKTVLAAHSLFANTKTVFTIHNLGYQGLFAADTFSGLGLPYRLFAVEGLEFYGKVNFLKGGIVFSDWVTTVSPTYAKEIQTPEFGHGLEGVLKAAEKKLVGILNGVDYSAWGPETDSYLVAQYGVENLKGKRRCKEDLLEQYQLAPDLAEKPLLGMISRLAGQKGIDLLCEVVERLMATGAGLVLLGSGEEKYERILTELASKYPRQMGVRIDFDESLAHKIEAGCDMFLMPSRYEPCGLNQMYSLRYGTLPIVRRTGGLADTVTEVNPKKGKGTGFTFSEYDPDALWGAIGKALHCFGDGQLWTRLVKQAMEADFSWSKSAREYLRLYRQVRSKL